MADRADRSQSHRGSAEAIGQREHPAPAWTRQLGAFLLLVAICGLAWIVDIKPPASETDRRPALQNESPPSAERLSSVTTPRAEPITEAACLDALRRAGVAVKTVLAQRAPGVDWPVMLTGPVDGVRVQGDASDAEASYLDCRLALAILAWAPELRAQGVVAVQHYSMYRHDAVVAGGAKQSGHARGTALDVAWFELRDGRKLNVLDDWRERTRGADPCKTYASDTDKGRELRGIVCDAVERGLFQTVITPHYNDAHGNHVHLEIGPADSVFVH